MKVLAKDGTLVYPYEEDSVVLIRSMPGARWNPETKTWGVSIKDADLARVIEVADRLGCDVDAELRDRLKRGTAVTRAALARASEHQLYPFQVEGVTFLSGHHRALLGDEMGCIDGAATVRLNRAGKGFALSLVELFNRFNGLRVHHAGVRGPRGRVWSKKIPTKIRALCNGELRLQTVRAVLDKGERSVLKLRLGSGKTLRLTPDHEVCVGHDRAGEPHFVRVDALRPGDAVLTNGQPACRICGSIKAVTTFARARFPGVCRQCMYRKLRAKPTFKGGRSIDQDGYVRVSGTQGHPRYTSGGVYEHILVVEKMLKRSLRADESIHHKNGDKADNRPENLEVLTKSEHARHHGREGGYRRMHGGRGDKGGLVTFVPSEDRVLSITPDGSAHVYDVVCDDPHRNFAANGIIVHNCGKTIMALVSLPYDSRVLVVCPASVKWNWKAEAEKWRPDYRVTVLEGKKSFRAPESTEIIIVNYDILPAWLIEPEKNEERKAEVPTEVAGLLTDTVLICDEAHLTKSHKAARSKKVRGLSALASRTWLLTGTPLLNKPFDLWGVLNAGGMAHEVFGGFGRFLGLFGATQDYFGAYKFKAPSPEVPERLRRVCLRRTKREVLPELPGKTYQEIEISSIDGKTRRELDDLLKLLEDRGEVTRDAVGAITKGLLPGLGEMSALRALLARSRIPAVLELVAAAEEANEPLVVFSAHREPVDMFATRDGWGVITGDTSPQARTLIVRDFQEGHLKGLAATIQAGGVGVTLTRAKTMVFVDLDWTPALNLQAEDRLVRIGQKAKGVLVQRLYSDHVLDQHIHHLLIGKQAMITAAIDASVQLSGNAVDGATEGLIPESDNELAERMAVFEAAEREITERQERAWVAERLSGVTSRANGRSQPLLSPETKNALREALVYLLSRCDGAHARDDAGFSATDAGLARHIGLTGLADDDDVSFRVLERMLSIYAGKGRDGGQLGAARVAAIWGESS